MSIRKAKGVLKQEAQIQIKNKLSILLHLLSSVTFNEKINT
jgi:hypothetical protein